MLDASALEGFDVLAAKVGPSERGLATFLSTAPSRPLRGFQRVALLVTMRGSAWKSRWELTLPGAG